MDAGRDVKAPNPKGGIRLGPLTAVVLPHMLELTGSMHCLQILNNCAIRLSWGRRTKALRERGGEAKPPPPYQPPLAPGGMRLPPPIFPQREYAMDQVLSWQAQQPGGYFQGGLPQGGLPQGGLQPGGMPQGGWQQGGVPQGGMPQMGLQEGGPLPSHAMQPHHPLPAGSLSDILSNPVAPGIFNEQVSPGPATLF